MPPAECPYQKQISDVRASDQQHEAHHRQSDREGREQRARVVEWSLPQGEQSYAAAAVRRRIIVLQAVCRRGYLRLGLLRSDARFEPHEALDPAGAAIF